MVYFIL